MVLERKQGEPLRAVAVAHSHEELRAHTASSRDCSACSQMLG